MAVSVLVFKKRRLYISHTYTHHARILRIHGCICRVLDAMGCGRGWGERVIIGL